jgi:hypothetical protein
MATHVLVGHSDTILVLTTSELGKEATHFVGNTDSRRDDGLTTDEPKSEAGHEPVKIDHQIRFRVSSRHLCSASTAFKAMLEGPWKESKGTDQEPREIHATEFNAEALHILLKMMHYEPNKDAETVALDTMRDLVIIADYYDCMKIIPPYGHQYYWDVWHSGTLSAQDILAVKDENKKAEILLVSWAFRNHLSTNKPDLFANITASIMRYGTHRLETDLPLPASLLDALEKERKKIVNFLAQKVNWALRRYRTQTVCCLFCDMTWLDGFLEDLRARGYDGLASDPFGKMSPRDLWTVIETNNMFPHPKRPKFLCPVFAARGPVFTSTPNRRILMPPMAHFRLTKGGSWLAQWKIGAWGDW